MVVTIIIVDFLSKENRKVCYLKEEEYGSNLCSFDAMLELVLTFHIDYPQAWCGPAFTDATNENRNKQAGVKPTLLLVLTSALR